MKRWQVVREKDIGDHSWHPDYDASLLAPAGQNGPQVVVAWQTVPDHLWGSVLLLGNFDALHVGHRALLSTARRHAALLKAPLGIMSCEPHPKQFFNPDAAPFRLSGPDAKRLICRRLGVDLLFMPHFDRDFASLTPQRFAAELLVGKLGVKAVVVGEDFRFGSGRSGSVADLRRFGFEGEFDVLVVPDLIVEGERISSTLVRSWVRAGDLEKVNIALQDAWITKLISNGSPTVTFEIGAILPPAGRYKVDLWNAKGDLVANIKMEVTADRTALVEGSKLTAGMHLVSDWRVDTQTQCAP